MVQKRARTIELNVGIGFMVAAERAQRSSTLGSVSTFIN